MRKAKSAPQRRPKPLLDLFDRDVPVDPVRARTMSRIRGKDTGPEVKLRKALFAKGLRYRVHDRSLPGTPDISNKSRKVAIFVDGCFWHGCPEHFKVPKTRSDFWQEKIRRNRKRRAAVLSEYSSEWAVFQFYECRIQKALGDCVTAIRGAFAQIS